jgi:hypothetical protein
MRSVAAKRRGVSVRRGPLSFAEEGVEMAKPFPPTREAELVTASTNFKERIVAAPTLYGLVEAQATAYAALHDDFVEAYQMANDPSTRTPSAIVAKNDAMAALLANLRELARIVQAAPNVSDEQRSILGLPVRSTHPTPVPPPTVEPGVDIVSSKARTVAINIHDSASSSKRGKPAGAVSAFVYTFVGPTYPSDPTAWQFQGVATRSKFAITFPETVAAGAQVWVCAAWVNRRGESGPPSVPITANLPGGGAIVTTEMKIAA